MTIRKLGVLVCASLVLVVVGLIPAPAEAQRSRGLPACDPDNGGLILPEGFCAHFVGDGILKYERYGHGRTCRTHLERRPESSAANQGHAVLRHDI